MSAPRLINKSGITPDMTPSEREDTSSMTQPSAKVKKARNEKFEIDVI
jgi:hypothetical protein